MNEIKYYKGVKDNVIQIVNIKEYDALSSIIKGLMCVFFVPINTRQIRCRSPPTNNLSFKNLNC